MKSSTGLLTLMCDVHYEQQSQSNNADKIHLSLGNIQVKASEKANQLHKYAHTSYQYAISYSYAHTHLSNI
jgi:hypothetical protein